MDTEGRQLWNTVVDRHQCLRYRRPFGAHTRYFLTDRWGRRLGFLLFNASARSLPCRERWIGWCERTRDRNRCHQDLLAYQMSARARLNLQKGSDHACVQALDR